MRREPSLSLATQDKLKIFVSSTIRECKDERAAARDGIKQTNHDYFIFEEVGSRSFPPRNLYLSNLRQSDIVVAIYRDSYGYIAPKQSHSGLEDEYRHAVKFGKWLLVYVRKDEAKRDPRLKALIDEILGSDTVTIYFYDDPIELKERIRDDVTALVAQRFLDADIQDVTLRQTSAETLSSISRGIGAPISRDSVLQNLRESLDTKFVIGVSGPPGAGKTVLLSQFSASFGYPIVFAEGLTPKDLFGTLTNKIKLRSADEAETFITLDAARRAFMQAWLDAPHCTLIIDASPHVDDVLTAARETVVPSSSKSIVFSTRASHVAGAHIFDVPRLSISEVASIIAAANLAEQFPDASGITKLTGGLPLNLRQKLLSQGVSTGDAWNALPATVREIATYIAVSPISLTIDDILALRGDSSYGPEHLLDDLDRMPALILATGSGFRPVHDEIRREMITAISVRLERLRFACSRVASHLLAKGRVVQAYFLYRESQDPKSDQLMGQAAFEAARYGDQKSSLAILEDLLRSKLKSGDKEEIIQCHLALAQAKEHVGDMSAANLDLEAAQAIATPMGADTRLFVREARLGFQGRRSHDAKTVEALRSLKQELSSSGDEWGRARVCVEISVLLINIHDGPGAESEAREALTIFAEYEDTYGAEIARRNLVSSLLYQEGRELEVDDHIRILDAEARPLENRRHRAWLCNVLVKRRRMDKKPDDAINFAKEAIALGKDLGDNIIVAINLIGLANALSDKNDYAEAISRYQEAASIAQKLARRDIESQASYLIANTYNELPANHPLSGDAPSLAEHHARHAIGLLRDTIGQDQLARAYDALGDSLQPHRNQEAAEAYFAAAEVLRTLGKWDRFEQVFLQAVYLSQTNIDVYRTGVFLALGINKAPNNESLVRTLFDPLDEILRSAPQNVMLSFLGIHFKLMFERLPPLIARRLFELIISVILTTELKDPTQIWRRTYPLIVLLACAGRHLTRYDLHRYSANIDQAVPGLTIRNTIDSGSYWYVALSYDSPVMLTIFALDDKLHSELAALVVALFLKGFENEFHQEILGNISLRSELEIQIVDAITMPEDLKGFVVDAMGDSPCQISRPARIETDSAEMPTYIFLNGNIFDKMNVGEGKGGALQIMLGLTAIEVAYRLLNGAIELTVLQPKIVKLVRSSI